MPYISYNKKLMIQDLLKQTQFHGESECHLKELHIDPDHSRIYFAASHLTGQHENDKHRESIFFPIHFVACLMGFKYYSSYDIYVYFDIANSVSSI